jgi:hypothetical protein
VSILVGVQVVDERGIVGDLRQRCSCDCAGEHLNAWSGPVHIDLVTTMTALRYDALAPCA